MTMRFEELPDFQKDCTRLGKKYRSIPDDLKEFQRVVAVVPLGSGKHCVMLTRQDVCYIIKSRFFCRYLKGSSLLRIVYAYHTDESRIVFIELYLKSDESREDIARYRNYLARLN